MKRYKASDVRWQYEHGLLIQSIYAVGKAVNDRTYKTWAKTMYDALIEEDGSIRTYQKDEFNLDQINPGKLLFELYRDTCDIKYRNAIETLREQLRQQPRTEANGFWHKRIYPCQMWLDGLYMQGPFYARYAAEFGKLSELHDVIAQLILAESRTRDPETGLLYHAWDESRKQLWANRQTGCSQHFWGRAVGWYCMALVDVLDYIPDDEEFSGECGELIAIVRRLSESLMRFQDMKSGLWYQVLDQGAREKNYLESSASAMFVYFLCKAVRMGYLASEEDRAKALAVSLAGYNGLVKTRLEKDPDGSLHLSGICSVAGLGGNPYRDGSFAYYVSEPVVRDDFKGVGPFILASLEIERL
jgi:unsaturated rhamnogalacturonyl hydrolase